MGRIKKDKDKLSGLRALGEQRRLESKRMVNLRKRIKDDLLIIVSKNISLGELYYLCPVTGQEYVFEDALNVLTFEQLRVMCTSQKKFLSSYWIVPIGIIEDDEDVSEEDKIKLEEVLKALNIENLYNGDMKEILTEGMLDLILLEGNISEYEEIIDTVNDEYFQLILERAIKLYNEGMLTDTVRMNILCEVTGNYELFKPKENKENQSRKLRKR